MNLLYSFSFHDLTLIAIDIICTHYVALSPYLHLNWSDQLVYLFQNDVSFISSLLIKN